LGTLQRPHALAVIVSDTNVLLMRRGKNTKSPEKLYCTYLVIENPLKVDILLIWATYEDNLGSL